MLGSSLAPVLFGGGTDCGGQSSTITGTFCRTSGDGGLPNFRLQPPIRRPNRVNRNCAGPVTIVILGDGATGKPFILSRVILSLQLGFVIIPLIHFVSDKRKMGEFVIRCGKKFWVRVRP